MESDFNSTSASADSKKRSESKIIVTSAGNLKEGRTGNTFAVSVLLSGKQRKLDRDQKIHFATKIAERLNDLGIESLRNINITLEGVHVQSPEHNQKIQTVLIPEEFKNFLNNISTTFQKAQEDSHPDYPKVFKFPDKPKEIKTRSLSKIGLKFGFIRRRIIEKLMSKWTVWPNLLMPETSVKLRSALQNNPKMLWEFDQMMQREDALTLFTEVIQTYQAVVTAHKNPDLRLPSDAFNAFKEAISEMNAKLNEMGIGSQLPGLFDTWCQKADAEIQAHEFVNQTFNVMWPLNPLSEVQQEVLEKWLNEPKAREIFQNYFIQMVAASEGGNIDIANQKMLVMKEINKTLNSSEKKSVTGLVETLEQWTKWITRRFTTLKLRMINYPQSPKFEEKDLKLLNFVLKKNMPDIESLNTFDDRFINFQKQISSRKEFVANLKKIDLSFPPSEALLAKWIFFKAFGLAENDFLDIIQDVIGKGFPISDETKNSLGIGLKDPEFAEKLFVYLMHAQQSREYYEDLIAKNGWKVSNPQPFLQTTQNIFDEIRNIITNPDFPVEDANNLKPLLKLIGLKSVPFLNTALLADPLVDVVSGNMSTDRPLLDQASEDTQADLKEQGYVPTEVSNLWRRERFLEEGFKGTYEISLALPPHFKETLSASLDLTSLNMTAGPTQAQKKEIYQVCQEFLKNPDLAQVSKNFLLLRQTSSLLPFLTNDQFNQLLFKASTFAENMHTQYVKAIYKMGEVGNPPNRLEKDLADL